MGMAEDPVRGGEGRRNGDFSYFFRHSLDIGEIFYYTIM